MNLQQKNVIVTGAGSGMGRELTLLLLSKGARVAGFDIHDDALQETKQLAGEKAELMTTHIVNVADASAVHEGVQAAIEEHEVIDCIINNAGIIQPFVKVNDLEMSAVERVLNVNFYGVVHMIKEALPHLLERPEAHIVNVSSMGGFLPVPGQSVYGASKAAVKLLTEGLYAELKDTHVHVSVVFPGAIATNITTNSGVAAPNISEEQAKQAASMQTLPADQAALQIVRGIEKNALRIYVGKDSKFLNMLYRVAPTFATNFIAKKMKDLLK